MIGTLHWSSPLYVMIAQWFMDLYHGLGHFTYTDKSTYEGHFHMGYREGLYVRYKYPRLSSKFQLDGTVR